MAENGGEDGREASVNSGRGGEPGSKMPVSPIPGILP